MSASNSLTLTPPPSPLRRSQRLRARSVQVAAKKAKIVEEVGPNYFEILPLEMKEQILEQLAFKDKKNVRLVCSQFKEIIDRRTPMKFTLSDKSLEAISGMDGDVLIDVLQVQDLSQTIGTGSRSRSSIVKNVRHLKFLATKGFIFTDSACDYCGHLNCPDSTETWVAGSGNSEDNIVSLLRLHPNIEALTFEAMSLEHVHQFGRLSTGLRLDLLTSIEFIFGDDIEELLIHDITPIQPYVHIMRNKFPALNTFYFDNRACGKPIDLLLAAYDFVCRHHALMKNVYINSERSYEYLFFPRSLQKWTKTLNELMGKIKLVQPKELFLRSASLVPDELLVLREFEREFASGQKRLEKVTISFIDMSMDEMLAFVPNCQNTLTSLRVDTGVYKKKLCGFDCELIKNCGNLKNLDLDIDNHEWSWFNSGREAAKIDNVHLLPKSITELKIEGYLPVEKSNAIFERLSNLRKFISTGYGRCGKNRELLTAVLKNSTVKEFILDNDKCHELDILGRRLEAEMKPALKVVGTWTGFKYYIDRNILIKAGFKYTYKCIISLFF